jgi:hypothetical protein
MCWFHGSCSTSRTTVNYSVLTKRRSSLHDSDLIHFNKDKELGVLHNCQIDTKKLENEDPMDAQVTGLHGWSGILHRVF